MKKLIWVSSGLLWVIPCFSSPIYVDIDATGEGNGSSWVNAYNHLQDALAVARYGDEILVAEGLYRPDRGTAQIRGDREATFPLVDGVLVKGGYAGAGHPEPDARDIIRYETVLSGDLDGNDGPDFEGNGENSYRVVSSSDIETIVGHTEDFLEGFTVQGGNAEVPYPYAMGGGILITSDMTVRNCRIIGNAARFGGGVSCGPSSCCVTQPALIHCTIEGNRAEEEGGGVFLSDSIVLIDRCTLSGNQAGRRGGGLMGADDNRPILVNSVIISNSAGEEGGAIRTEYSFDWGMTNCTVAGNSAGRHGGGLSSIRDQSVFLTNCIFWGNTPAEFFVDRVHALHINFCCIRGGWEGENSTGIIDMDPLFVDAEGEDFHLSPESPCIDTGTVDYAPFTVYYAPFIDRENHGRPCGEGVDMGAYEMGDCPPSTRFRRADPNADNRRDVSDAVFTLLYLFSGGKAPTCLKAADSDDSGKIDLTDAVYLLNYLFLGGPRPEEPFPDCGLDPTIDDLTCESFIGCL